MELLIGTRVMNGGGVVDFKICLSSPRSELPLNLTSIAAYPII